MADNAPDFSRGAAGTLARRWRRRTMLEEFPWCQRERMLATVGLKEAITRRHHGGVPHALRQSSDRATTALNTSAQNQHRFAAGAVNGHAHDGDQGENGNNLGSHKRRNTHTSPSQVS